MMWSKTCSVGICIAANGLSQKACVENHRPLNSISILKDFCDSKDIDRLNDLQLRSSQFGYRTISPLVQVVQSVARGLQVNFSVAAMASCGLMARYRSGLVVCLLC